MKLSLVFPAYNESASIAAVLATWAKYCATHRLEAELIVVNDGSRDRTGDAIHELTLAYPSIRLIEHPNNRGYGAALRTGFAAATGDYIFMTDSDGQFYPEDLQQTLPKLRPDACVIGWRENRADGWPRRFNARLWNWCVRLTLGLRVRDVNCAWKIFPRSFFADLTLRSTGALINAELLFNARRKNFSLIEIPIRHYPRRSGSPTGANPRVIWRALVELHWFLRHRQ